MRLPDVAFISGAKAPIIQQVVREVINMWIVRWLQITLGALIDSNQCDRGGVVHENPIRSTAIGIDFFTEFLPGIRCSVNRIGRDQNGLTTLSPVIDLIRMDNKPGSHVTLAGNESSNRAIRVEGVSLNLRV